MKKAVLMTLALCLLITIPAAAGSRVAKILEFDTMAAVSEPYTGDANPIRGVNGGGLPWELSSARGELKIDGTLEISVRGLVLARRAPVPPARQGTNPVNAFRAIVSCLSSDSAGNATTVTITTDQFPATSTGDSDIEAVVGVPEPCFAPIIFVTAGSR